MDAELARGARFSKSFLIRLPELMARGLQNAADRELTTQSEYARRAILKQLKVDGVPLAESGATNV